MNSGKTLGLGWVQTTTGKGVRSSSATSYLGPGFINRTNLHVLINAQVAHLLKCGTEYGLPAFKTVEYRSGGQTKQVTARKEVILCAGAVGTPQVLLNSGIGDPTDLQKVGVKPTFKLPDVGKNLQDHTLVFNSWLVNSTDTWEKILRDPKAVNASLAEWQAKRTGFMTDGVVSHLIWKKTPPNSPVVKQYGDKSSGPNSGNIELMFSNGFLGPTPPTGNYITIITALVSPVGRGSVKLSSNDPYEHPLIDPGLLTHPHDLGTMVEAVKMSERLLSAPVWKDYVLEKFGDFKNTSNDDEIVQYLRNHAGTVFHPVATASMSKKGATTGVVDPNLKVKGISGLRVVDASIWPFTPAAHTQAPVYIIAERAADVIKSGA
jgi:choline dehydrogenase-like flavoprotein